MRWDELSSENTLLVNIITRHRLVRNSGQITNAMSDSQIWIPDSVSH